MGVVRLALGLLVLYMAADLASPLIPGAFAFDPDDSVEASRLERTSQAVPIAVGSSSRSAPVPLPPRPSPRIVRAAAGGAQARHRDGRPPTRPGAHAATSPRSDDPPA